MAPCTCRRTVIKSSLCGTEKMSPLSIGRRKIVDNEAMKNLGDLKLSVKEARRVYVLEKLCSGEKTNQEAAQDLKLSVRQIQRIKQAFRLKAHEALVHGNKGRKPVHALSEELKNLIAQKAEGDYKGTSCQHMAELLEREESIKVSAKSILRIMKERGTESVCSHKAPRKRLRRARRPRLGELLQIDASPFDWLSNETMLSLHGAIDDATGTVVALWLEETERLDGYFHVLRLTLENYGIPQAIYSDAHTIFFSPLGAKTSLEDDFEGRSVPLTQFGKALDTLGIQAIKAGSPQAKGRIERLWRTLQLRLPVELRLAGITTIEEANIFLTKFAKELSERFGVVPSSAENAFLPAPSGDILRYVLCTRENRVVAGGSVISWKSKKWMAEGKGGNKKLLRKGAKVEVLTLLDKSFAIAYAGEFYPLREIAENERLEAAQKKEATKVAAAPKSKAHIPAKDHPWRRGFSPKVVSAKPALQTDAVVG